MTSVSRLRTAVRGRVARRMGLPEIPTSLERLARNGFVPKHIFDVGAYRGDFATLCVQVWPGTTVTAFEVLEDKVSKLRSLASGGLPIEVVPFLVGAEDHESVPFHVMETASSVLDEHTSQKAPVVFYPMRRLDKLVSDNHLESPDFLKLDVQGYELEVLRGAECTLRNASAILIELNFLDIHKGVPLASEVIAWLDERGWAAYDICGLTRRPLDDALWQADLVFVPRDSPLRSDKRWSYPAA